MKYMIVLVHGCTTKTRAPVNGSAAPPRPLLGATVGPLLHVSGWYRPAPVNGSEAPEEPKPD